MTTRSPTGVQPEPTPRKETKPSTSREKHPFFCDKILVFFADDSTMSPFFAGSLAQSVEQLAFNQLVDGSNPSRPTIFFRTSSRLLFLFDLAVSQSTGASTACLAVACRIRQTRFAETLASN